MARTLFFLILLVGSSCSAQILWVGGGQCSDLNYLYMAPTGDAFSLSSTKGIMKSTDKGRSWRAANKGVQIGHINRITWTTSGLFAVTGGHIYRSTDDGANWTDLPMFNKHTVVTEAPDHSLLLGTTTGIKRSIDSGATWTPVGEGVISFRIEDITFGTDGIGYAIGNNLYRSTDFGVTWDSIWSANGGDYRRVALDSKGRIYIGGYGLFRSEDGGTSFTKLVFAEMTDPPYVMAIDFHFDKLFISTAKTFLNSVGPGLFYSSDDGGTWNVDLEFVDEGITGVVSDSEGYLYAGSMMSGNIYRSKSPLLEVVENEEFMHPHKPVALSLSEPEHVSSTLGQLKVTSIVDITGKTIEASGYRSLKPGVYILELGGHKSSQKLLLLP